MRKITGQAVLLLTPLVAILGLTLFGGKRWDVAAVLMAFLCCVPFFLSFEKRRPTAREVVLVSVMTAFSVAGRLLFAVIPFFKPVTAVVIIAAMYFGSGAGFMTGAMSALISNIWFGQGAWTPFQMLCWGIIGWGAGMLNRRGWLQKPALLCICGAAAGALYSLVMDLWTVLSAEGALRLSRWMAVALTSLPVTLMYCISNVIFLLILRKPLGSILGRLRNKYGLFCEDEYEN